MMSQNRYVALTALILAALLALVPSGGAAALTTADYPEFYLDRGPLADGFLLQQKPEIEGEFVVYQYRNLLALPPSDSSWNIAARNLNSGTHRTFPILGSDQTNPDVAAGRVVFESTHSGNGDIYTMDLRQASAGSPLLIGSGPAAQVRPRVSASHAVWLNDTNGTLEYFDFATWTMSTVPESGDAEYWDVDGDTLVFSVAGNPQDRLYSWRLGEMANPVEIYPGYNPLAGYPSIEHVRLHAMRAYVQLAGLTSRTALIDLRWGLRTYLPAFSQQMTRPNLFDRSLVWESWEADPDANRALHFFIVGVNSVLDATNDDTQNFTRPSIFGNRLVYQAGTNGDIWMAADKPRVDRTYGADRYETAVEISKAYFPDGPANGWDGNISNSYTVVLATGENFPDALAATPLAAQVGGPLLLTRTTALPQVVIDELERLKPWRVIVVGGKGVVSQEVTDALSAMGAHVDRVAGDDRYETSVEIADKYLSELAYAGVVWDGGVVIARGDAFPDALAAGPAAAGMYRPIFLTRPTQLPTVVDDWLSQREIEEVIMVGGTTAVGESVETALNAILDSSSSPHADRWYGADRYATAADVARNAYYRRALDFDMIGIATGENFPDALGGGAACGYYGSPLLLTRNASVPVGLSDFLATHEYAIGRGDIFGGTSVVGEPTRTGIRALLK